jgi:hypothetical protein
MVEIKHVKLAPFTMMTAWIQAILAIIFAIIFVIVGVTVAAFIPQLAPLLGILAVFGLSLIIISPIITFMVNVVINFISAGFYNLLVPRVGGIQLEMEGDELNWIPVVPFSLILACVGAIWAFIIGLILALIIVPFTTLLSTSIPVIAQAIANATNATLPTGAFVGTGGVVLALVLIIGLPIAVFIMGFISNALFAIFYNYIATRVAKVKLEFAVVTGTLNELTSIPVVPAALAAAVVMVIFGLIRGIMSLITFSMAGNAVMGVETLIYDIIGYFIAYFIIVALVAIIYNFLQPRIGRIKLDLE